MTSELLRPHLTSSRASLLLGHRTRVLGCKSKAHVRQSLTLRCESTGFNSAHRCDSNQDTSCSGRHWIRSTELPSNHTSKSSISCNASAAQSDVHLPGSGDIGGAGGSGAGGSSGRGDGRSDGHEGSGDDEEFLGEVEAEAIAARSGISLPKEFLAAAAAGGLRSSVLQNYIKLQAGAITGFFSRALPAVRNRLLLDPRFLFKVGAEVAIDAGCATVAEVRKRGDDFWGEFEFYLSDLVVGCVLDCVLVGLLAPSAALGPKPKTKPTGLALLLEKVPSAVFQGSLPGMRRYTFLNRAACLGVKFLEYSLAGMFCGFLGQGVANGMMLAKRKYYGSKEGDVKIPSVTQTALVWGLFMGTSSNVRYQAVFGIERAVDLTIAKKVPQAAYVATIVVRFINNIIGGENFIDMARWAGVQ